MSNIYGVLHKGWRCIPRVIRRPLFQAVVTLLAPGPSPPADVEPGPVTVAGLLTSTTGLGEGARLCLSTLDQFGLDTQYFDLSHVFRTHDLPDGTLRGQPARPGEDGLLIVHINPHMIPLAFTVMGRARVKRKRVIGYWAWELPAIPANWKKGFKYVHEIWVPSQFTANAFRPYTYLPVRVVPYPVARPAVAELRRVDFGLPERAFVALTMFHMGSGFVRKNPIAAVQAFRLAFGNDPSAFLVVKVADPEVLPWAMRALKSAIGSAPNIRIMHDKLSREGVAALVSCADAVLSLHRSEGFGLVLAQAMLLEKPVVATGWSGNTDFMTDRNSVLIDYTLVPVRDPQGSYMQRDQLWAEPNVEHAAQWLWGLASNADLRRNIGQAAAKDAAYHFSVSSYKAAIGSSFTLASRGPQALRRGKPA